MTIVEAQVRGVTLQLFKNERREDAVLLNQLKTREDVVSLFLVGCKPPFKLKVKI